MAKGGGTKGGFKKCPFQPEKSLKTPENAQLLQSKFCQEGFSGHCFHEKHTKTT